MAVKGRSEPITRKANGTREQTARDMQSSLLLQTLYSLLFNIIIITTLSFTSPSMESIDFRAPPPSPVASARRSSLANDDVFSHFLEASLRVPALAFPSNEPRQQAPPKVDFRSLCFHQDRVLRDVVSDSLATIGCFQLLNHGIPPELMTSTAEAAVGIFRVPPEKRAAAMRSPEKPCGFEEYEDAEEEEEGSELSEEFVWCRDHDLQLKMEGIWSSGYSNFSEKMDTLLSGIEKVAEKILPVIFEDFPEKFANSADMFRGHELGTLCCVYKHGRDNMADQWANTLKYDVIRMLVRGTDYSHSLCLHVCYGSSEFNVYSKKGWLSFFPEEGALVITGGDQTQILSDGYYKHVIGKPIFKGEKEDNISMAFLYSPPNTRNNYQTNMERTISLGQQAILAIILTLLYHVLIYVYKKL